jgi:hypothetical protein
MLKLKTPPVRGLDASATRILSNKRVDIFSNDNTEDFSPALKYNMNSTPSKKIKLRPLKSSSKKTKFDDAIIKTTPKSFGILSTPNNLKFSTGKSNVKTSSRQKSNRKALGTLRGANNGSIKKKNQRKKVRNVKPLNSFSATKSKKVSVKSTRPFYKQQQIFVNVPCGHLQNSRFQKCAEKKCVHECCKRYFQLESISLKPTDNEDIIPSYKSTNENNKMDRSGLSLSKKKPLPTVSKVTTPNLKYKAESGEIDEKDHDNIHFQQAIKKSNKLYSEQKKKFEKLMEEHSKQATSFQKLLSTPEHSVDRACKPGLNDNNDLLYGDNDINESIESIDDDSGWESDDVPPPPPPPEHDDYDDVHNIDNTILSGTTSCNNVLEATMLPPKLDLNPVFDRIISKDSNHNIHESNYNNKSNSFQNIKNEGKLDLVSKNYAKHFVEKIEASILKEKREKRRKCEDDKSFLNTAMPEEKMMETQQQKHQQNNQVPATATTSGFLEPKIDYKNATQSATYYNSKQAPRSAKKRARIDSSYSTNYGINNTNDGNKNRAVLDSRDYFEISIKLQHILKKIDLKSNRNKLRQGFSFLMRNALKNLSNENTAEKAQRDAVKDELKRSTKIADMVRRGNYNLLQKKIEELANRLEEEQAMVEIVSNNRRKQSTMVMMQQETYQQQQQPQHFHQYQDRKFPNPPPAPQHQPQNSNMLPPQQESSNATSQQKYEANSSFHDVHQPPQYYQQYKNKTVFYGDKQNAKAKAEPLNTKSEVDDAGYKAAIETYESILNENVRDPRNHAALDNLKTFLHLDATNNNDTRPKTSVNHLKNITNTHNNSKYPTPKERFEIPQDFDALLEAMHIASVRRRVIKETTEPDMIKWNVRYIKRKGNKDDDEDSKESGENALVVCRNNGTSL